jgi:hypothetical protein
MTVLHPAERSLRLRISAVNSVRRASAAKQLKATNLQIAVLAAMALEDDRDFDDACPAYGFLDVAYGIFKVALDHLETKNTLTIPA